MTWLLGVVTFVSLWLAWSWWAALLAGLSICLAAGHIFGAGADNAFLVVEPDGSAWALRQHSAVNAGLTLQHVWHGPFWTTLKFSRPVSGQPLELTLWRSDVSSSHWRRLRQLVARGYSQPRQSMSEGE